MAREDSNYSVVRVTPAELAAFKALQTPCTSAASVIREHVYAVMEGVKPLYSNSSMASMIASGGASYPASDAGQYRTAHYGFYCGKYTVNEVSAFAKAKGTTISGLIRQCLLVVRDPLELLRVEEARLEAQMEAAEKALRRLEGQLDAVALKIRALTQQSLFPTDQAPSTAR